MHSNKLRAKTAPVSPTHLRAKETLKQKNWLFLQKPTADSLIDRVTDADLDRVTHRIGTTCDRLSTAVNLFITRYLSWGTL